MLKFTRGEIMKDNKLTIEIRNGEASIGTESPISILDLLELTLQLQLLTTVLLMQPMSMLQTYWTMHLNLLILMGIMMRIHV